MANYYDEQRVILERFQLYISHQLTWPFANEPKIDVVREVTGGLSARFLQYIAAQEVEKIEERWPATWWDAVKDRWLPEMLKCWAPVRFKYLKVEAKVLYPKIALPNHVHHLVMLTTNRDYFEPEIIAE